MKHLGGCLAPTWIRCPALSHGPYLRLGGLLDCETEFSEHRYCYVRFGTPVVVRLLMAFVAGCVL